MTDTWVTGVHEGYRTKVVKVGNCTIEINRPILTDEERRKRERQVMDALIHFGRSETHEKKHQMAVAGVDRQV